MTKLWSECRITKGFGIRAPRCISIARFAEPERPAYVISEVITNGLN